jgi:hypothetical protein
MAAKRPLRDGLHGARSAVWSIHTSDEQQSRPPARALPDGFRATGSPASLRALRMLTDIRRSARLGFEASGSETRLMDITESTSRQKAPNGYF